ncbi:hypothetical protein [Nocardiopsis rhodophaea]|uniref:hypothetical protein n=1 Tax=Nocardiopsis rhodophaea TaxID=280238 RepID=UPI0031D1BB59
MALRDTRLRRRCAKLLREIDPVDPFDIHELVARVASWQNRPITLIPRTMSAGLPCGLWIAGNSRDFIYHEENTTPLHQEHIIAHELGHIIFGHQEDDPEFDEHVAKLMMPSLPQVVIERALGRTHQHRACENEAETFASITMEWATDHRPSRRPASERLAQRLERISKTLEDDRGKWNE